MFADGKRNETPKDNTKRGSITWVNETGLVNKCKNDFTLLCLTYATMSYLRHHVCGHCLVTLSLTINETLKWLSSLPILMQVILVVTA